MLERLREYIRPLQGAVMLAVLLIGAIISGVLELAHEGLGVRFTIGVAGWFRAIPAEFYVLLGALAGAYTLTRGAEKITSIRNTAKYDPPARTQPVDEMVVEEADPGMRLP